MEENKKIKIACLASFTFEGIQDALRLECTTFGTEAEFYFSPYNQYEQVILDEKSELFRFAPDIIFLFVDYRSFFADVLWNWNEMEKEEKEKYLQIKEKEFLNRIHILATKIAAKIVVHNFEVPSFSACGILENKEVCGFSEAISRLNLKIAEFFSLSIQVFVFDYNGFISEIGKKECFDYKMYYLADIRFHPKRFPELARAYTSYIRPLFGKSRKCLVLDLDNTLWGGVIGEDGMEGIHLGPTIQGRPFWELQKYIYSLYQRGVILAINSANNFDDALEVIEKHPYMVLKKECFAAFRMNWNKKDQNMRELAEELNIGLDSLVFIDDDPYQRTLMQTMLPEVVTVEVPKDTSLLLSTIQNLSDFTTLQLTQEDKQRGVSYAQDRERRVAQTATSSLEEFLHSLQVVVSLQKKNFVTISRIAQLTQKTNQFNVTTKRYTEENITVFFHDDKMQVYTIEVEDKFGQQGLTGVAIVKTGTNVWSIDSFLLSCRILGKKIETVLLNQIMSDAKNAGAKTLQGEFIPTKKNMPAMDFYRNSGFTQISQNDQQSWWSIDLSKILPQNPEWITLKYI